MYIVVVSDFTTKWLDSEMILSSRNRRQGSWQDADDLSGRRVSGTNKWFLVNLIWELTDQNKTVVRWTTAIRNLVQDVKKSK